MEEEVKKVRRNLKGWEILYFASLLYILYGLIGGVAGSLLGAFGFIFLIISTVEGISNIAKKRHSSNRSFTVIMTIISIIVFLTAVSFSSHLRG